MFAFPPLPPWDGLHPLVVHFPIALILTAPLLVALALVFKKHARGLLLASTVVMVLGAAGAWVATSTGSAAEDFAEQVPGAKAILEEHEELGELACNVATVLAALLVVAAGIAWKWADRLPRGLIVAAGLTYLVANAACGLIVANAAHQGGRLVHEIGVRARLGGDAAGSVGLQPREHTRDDD